MWLSIVDLAAGVLAWALIPSALLLAGAAFAGAAFATGALVGRTGSGTFTSSTTVYSS